MQSTITCFEGRVLEQQTLIGVLQSTVKTLEEKSRREEDIRRELHNTVQELKGNIRVYCRVRPSTRGEGESDALEFDDEDVDGRKVTLLGRSEQSLHGSVIAQKRHDFEFDRVFRSHHRQDDLFKELKQLVQSSLDGYRVVVFAYGQTGAGKVSR